MPAQKKTQTSDEIKRLKIMYQGLFDNMKSGVVVYKAIDNGKDFVFKDFNKAAEKFNNVRKKDILGKKLTKVFPGVKKMGLLEVFQKVYEDGRARNHPVSFYEDKDLTQWAENYVFRLPTGEIVAIYDDVTKDKKREVELKSREERFDMAMKGTSDGLWDWDMLTNEVYYSPRWKGMLGYKDEEIKNEFESFVELIVNKDKDRVLNYVQDYVKSGGKKDFETEFKMKHKDGSEVDILARAFLAKRDGKPVRMVGTHIDMTERKLIEADLYRKTIFNQKILDTAKAIILVLDTEGRIKFFNKYLESLTGKSLKKYKGKDWFSNFLPEADFDKIRKLFKESLKDKDRANGYVNPILNKDGKKIFIEWYDDNLKDDEGNTSALLAVGYDVTARLKRENEVKENEERYKSLFEGSQDAIMILSLPNWKFSSGNAAAIKLFQVKDEKEFTKLGPWAVSPELQPNGKKSADEAKKMIEKALKEGSSQFEWMHRTIKKRNFLASVLLSRIKHKGEDMIQATVRDISRQKKAELELQEKLEDLEKMNKLMVGRELKMIELKKEISELKKKIENGGGEL